MDKPAKLFKCTPMFYRIIFKTYRKLQCIMFYIKHKKLCDSDFAFNRQVYKCKQASNVLLNQNQIKMLL